MKDAKDADQRTGLKVGIIARAENRGLGIQTWEAYRNLRPARVLVIDPGPLGRGHRMHLDRFRHARTVVGWDGHRVDDEATVKAWLSGLDVVYSAETLYDWRIADWARDAGGTTVVHVNPEFFKHDDPNLAHPDAWWSATVWRHEHLPPGTRVVPMPCPTDRWRDRDEPWTGDRPLRVLHVAGKAAARDRNGTLTVLEANRRTQSPRLDVRIASQDRNLRRVAGGRRRQVTLSTEVDDYWMLYPGHDLLLLPRRYGGLCLPAIEAMGAGLAVAMTDVEPQASTWPILPIPARATHRPMRTPAGMIAVHDTDPRLLARTLDRWASSPDEVADAQHAARQWAQESSWRVLRERWDLELARVARGAS